MIVEISLPISPFSAVPDTLPQGHLDGPNLRLPSSQVFLGMGVEAGPEKKKRNLEKDGRGRGKEAREGKRMRAKRSVRASLWASSWLFPWEILSS